MSIYVGNLDSPRVGLSIKNLLKLLIDPVAVRQKFIQFGLPAVIIAGVDVQRHLAVVEVVCRFFMFSVL